MLEFVLFGYLAYRIAGKSILPEAPTCEVYEKPLTFSKRYLKSIGLGRFKHYNLWNFELLS